MYKIKSVVEVISKARKIAEKVVDNYIGLECADVIVTEYEINIIAKESNPCCGGKSEWEKLQEELKKKLQSRGLQYIVDVVTERGFSLFRAFQP